MQEVNEYVKSILEKDRLIFILQGHAYDPKRALERQLLQMYRDAEAQNSIQQPRRVESRDRLSSVKDFRQMVFNHRRLPTPSPRERRTRPLLEKLDVVHEKTTTSERPLTRVHHYLAKKKVYVTAMIVKSIDHRATTYSETTKGSDCPTYIRVGVAGEGDYNLNNKMITVFDDVVILVAYTLSLIGTLFVIINYLLYAHLQTVAFKFVFHLTISNFLWTLAVLLNIICALDVPHLMSNQYVCSGLASLKLFSHLSGLLWTAMISQKLYDSIFKDEEAMEEEISASFDKAFLISYLLPAISAIGLLSSGDYGHVYPFYRYNCFLGDDQAKPEYWLRSLIVRLIFYYLPIWALFIFITFIVIRISFFILRHLQDGSDKSFLYKLFLFPVIILICWIPITIRKVLADFSVIDAKDFSKYGTKLPNQIDFILIGLNGFLNSLVYSYHTLIKERTMTEIYESCCCFCCIYFKRMKGNEQSFTDLVEEQPQQQPHASARIEGSNQDIELLDRPQRASEFHKSLTSHLHELTQMQQQQQQKELDK